MGFPANFLTYILSLCTILPLISCLYEDQIGKFDWRQQYIGKIRHLYYDLSTVGPQKIIVGTDENVIACLSTRTGSVIWRQILENDDSGIINSMSEDGDLVTVSGKGQYIRGWDATTGIMQWETSFPQELPLKANVYFYINSAVNEVIRVELIPKQYAKVLIYNYAKSSLSKSNSIEIPWYNDNANCSFISSAYFLCTRNIVEKPVYILPLKDTGSFMSMNVPGPKGNLNFVKDYISAIRLPFQKSNEKPFLAFQSYNTFYLYQIRQPKIILTNVFNVNTETNHADYKITAGLISSTLFIFTLNPTKEKEKYQINLIEIDRDIEVNYQDEQVKQSNSHSTFTLTQERGNIVSFHVLPFVKKDGVTSYKVFLQFEDHSILVFSQQGRLLWSREEALSKIVSTEILDLPLSETDATIEQEYSEPNEDIISMFLNRLKSQVHLLQSFILNSVLDLKNDGTEITNDKKSLTRDTFGLHKIIVVLTKPGKIFGIDNMSGIIIWSNYVPNFLPYEAKGESYFALFVQRTTAHFPYPPVCTAVGKQTEGTRSKLYSFNPITGATLESKELSFQVISAMPSGILTHHLRHIILLNRNLDVHIYPKPLDITKFENFHFIFTANTSTGTLTGYMLKSSEKDALSAVEIWKVKLPQMITHVVTKRPFEHVHSQGRVMGDRSVLYKYLNPNLAAIFTEGLDTMQKPFFNIYLIDVITGLTIYSASHKRCKGPSHIVHSENWLIYNFFNEKSRRYEISSLELFEGKVQSNTTAFSSFAPPPLPLIEHQTFIFPCNILAMTDTVTDRGLTNKHLLIALPSGGIFELPKAFLDPRRPITPLPEHREEGLIPYIPELPIMSEGILNYNQSVMRVKKIVTAPSSLESTCLVFVHGLDLFYTRATPSKTFDILKDDFDHYLISVVLFGLLALSYTTKKLAARKTLRAAWK